MKSVKEALEALDKLEKSFDDYYHQTLRTQRNIKAGHTTLENQMKFHGHHINEFRKSQTQLENYLKSMQCKCCGEELTYRNQGGSWNTICYPCRRGNEE